MNELSLQTRLMELDSFQAWQEAATEQRTAAQARPQHISLTNRDHLRSQMGYLDAREGQLSARQEFMTEIAEQDDTFLPVTYRLGLLAAYEVTKTQPEFIVPRRPRVSKPSLSLQIRTSVDTSEQRVTPANLPLQRAIQIGDELIRISRILDRERPVPVAMVWNYYYNPPRISRDEVVAGHISNPAKAFKIEAPQVVNANGVNIIKFTIPTQLKGVEKGEIVSKNEYVQSESKYKNPDIPTLSKLVHNDKSLNVDALYIGKKEVDERVKKARADESYRQTVISAQRSRSQRKRVWR